MKRVEEVIHVHIVPRRSGKRTKHQDIAKSSRRKAVIRFPRFAELSSLSTQQSNATPSQLGGGFAKEGIESIGSVCPRDSAPMFGTGSSSLRIPRDPSPLPLRGLVCVQPEASP